MQCERMIGAIVSFVVAVGLIVLGTVCRKGRKQGVRKTTAVIDRVLPVGSGIVYYISFREKNRDVIAKTREYAFNGKDYEVGSKVKIEYWYDGTFLRVEIPDGKEEDEINPIEVISKIACVVGVIMLAISVGMFLGSIQ